MMVQRNISVVFVLLSLPFKLSLLVGIEFFGDSLEKRKKILMKLFFWFCFVNLVIFCALLYTQAVIMFGTLSAIAIIADVTSTTTFTWKFLQIFLFRSVLGDIFQELDSFGWTQLDAKVKGMIKNFSKFQRIQGMSLVFAMSFYLLTPLWYLIKNDDFYQHLPFKLWLPFDVTQNKYLYYLTYMWMLAMGHLIEICFFVPDYIIGAVIILLSAQLIILKQRIASETISHRLIDEHYKIIELTKKFNDLFSPSMLINLVGSSFILCLYGFQLSMTHDSVNFLRNGVSLIVSLGQIFVFCFFGQIIKDSGEEIFETIYTTDWYSMPPKDQKAINIMQLAALKPIELRAWKFSALDYKTFFSVRFSFDENLITKVMLYRF